MSDALWAYLSAIDPSLCDHLDDDGDLSLVAAEHLYRYSVVLLQGLVEPAHVREDWEDYFALADAFVFAHGSRRLRVLGGHAPLLEALAADEAAALTRSDQSFLICLVRDLGKFVSDRQHTGDRRRP